MKNVIANQTSKILNREMYLKQKKAIKLLTSMIEENYDNITLEKQVLFLSEIGNAVQKSLKSTDCFYFLIPCNIEIENAIYKTYGIGAMENGVIIDCVPDLSVDADAINSLIYTCNKEKLYPIHLRDIAEDFVNT